MGSLARVFAGSSLPTYKSTTEGASLHVALEVLLAKEKVSLVSFFRSIRQAFFFLRNSLLHKIKAVHGRGRW